MLKRSLPKFHTFLFANRSPLQTIFKNTFWLALAHGVSKLMKLVLLIYVARILGATEYGKFTFAFAFVSLFLLFYDFGLANIVTRELARDKEKEKEFASILSLKILLTLGTLALILGASLFITPSPLIRKLIWILAIYTATNNLSNIIIAFFRARQKMQYEAASEILKAVILTGVGLFVIFNFPSVENLSYAYLFAGLSSLTLVLLIFHFKIFPLKIAWKKMVWQKFLKMSWPLGMAAMIGLIYTQIDSVMMGYLKQITETGWYNAAYRIVGVALIPVGLISLAFYPALSKSFKQSKEALQKIWNFEVKIMTCLAIPMVVGGLVFAPKIISWIYGPEFFPAILAFQLLIIMAGISFFQEPLQKVLVVTNQQKRIIWLTLIGATTNIGLDLFLIPHYSLYGAAVATIIAQFIVFLMLILFVARFTPLRIPNYLNLLRITSLVILSAVIMTSFLLRLSFLNIF